MKDNIDPKLAPIEVRNRLFKRSLFGYSVQQVSEFLDLVGRQMERMLRQEKELGDKLQGLNEEITKWKGREAEVAKEREQMLVEAEMTKSAAAQQAQRILDETEERAEGIRRRTEEWLETVLAQVEETERRRSHFLLAFQSALDSHYELIKQEQEPKEPLGQRLSQFLKSAESRLPS